MVHEEKVGVSNHTNCNPHQCTVREQFHSKLTELFNYPKQGCPSKKGDKFYFSRNSGLQNQS